MAYEIVTYTDEDGKLVTCKKEDAPEWVQHNWPQPLTFRKEGNNIYVSHSKKEEPKPECDHIVGFFAAETSYGAGLFQIEPGEDVSQYGSDVYYCKFCPECGEKLNLKKDE